MSNIRIQKIDWVEFVTYKDYLRLKEENKKLNEREIELRTLITELRIKIWEYKNSVSDLEDELDVKTCENKRLKSDYDRLDKVASENVRTLDELNAEIIGLKEENKKLKERINELEATNKKRTADNWATFKS